MNDDQIRSELERRAASAASAPDWTRRVLLPAVWHETDARPQPVVTSRWSMGLGVAGLVVALLVLVVAVPRLTPQPPAASPPALEVLSTRTFAAGVQSGALVDQAVLVEGSVVTWDRPQLFDAMCEPNAAACPIGQLDGVTPRLLVYGTDVAVADKDGASIERSNGWPWWHRSTPPLSGTLMLSVSGEFVEYVGRVVPAADGLTWSPGQVKTQLLTSARDLDEVVLVNGWLTGIGVAASCGPRGAAPPIAGLPLRDGCGQASWLADEAAVIDPFDQLIPPSAVQVQATAFADYAPDPSARTGSSLTPQRAVYGIAPRLYGNGCIDPTQPCWDWAVVGRLSQSAPDVTPPSIAPVITPDIAPSPSSPIADGSVLTCPNEASTPVSLIDHTGTVLGCTSALGTESLIYDVDVSNPDGNAQVLNVTMGLTSCPLGDATLEFWEPPASGSLGEQFRSSHVLQVDRTVGVGGCGHGEPENTSETFTLTLAEPIEASNVDAFLTTGPLGINTVETHGQRFALELKAGSETYVAGSAIDVSATSTYLGPGSATVSTYGISFGFEQLDGTLEMYPASTAMCGGLRTLQPNDQDVRPYSKSGGWSSSDPNASFYDGYIRDPELHLPAGVYRIFAGLTWANESCGGEPMQVLASIVITVVGDQSPSPTPSATPQGATFECTGAGIAVTLHDDTGQVSGCRMNDSAEVVPQSTITNPDGDLSRLRVTAMSRSCIDSVEAHFSGRSGSFGLRIQTQPEPSPGEVCGGFFFISFDLDLWIEVDASTVSVGSVPTSSPMASPIVVADALWVTFCTPSTDPEEFANGKGLVLQAQSGPAARYWFHIVDGTDSTTKANEIADDPAVCDASPVYVVLD